MVCAILATAAVGCRPGRPATATSAPALLAREIAPLVHPVAYRPDTELRATTSARGLPQQFDAVIHLDQTTAVQPF